MPRNSGLKDRIYCNASNKSSGFLFLTLLKGVAYYLRDDLFMGYNMISVLSI